MSQRIISLSETEANLRRRSHGLKMVAARLEETLLTPFNKADEEFNTTPSDAAWASRQDAVTDIRAAEGCTPFDLKRKIEAMRSKSARILAQAEEERDRAFLSQQVGRILPRRQMKRAA